MPVEAPIGNWHQIACEILATDADLILLLLDSLVSWDSPQTVARTVQNARERYEEVCGRKKHASLSQEESASIEQKLDQLRLRLHAFGQRV